jgi:RHS repeat-associated protein
MKYANLLQVHSHHNAKPILLTNSTGAVVAYSGHAVLGFPGQFANAVGLAGAQYYYNRYRDYNDTTGRYIQADPIGLAGDANPYAYAMGKTLRYSDPDGLQLVPRAVLPPQLSYRPANAFDAQIIVLNARGRELNPRYQGFRQLGNGATAQDVMVATNMFARTQAAWAATYRVCLDSAQPGAGYRGPIAGGNATPVVIVATTRGNSIPLLRGQYLTGSPNGDFLQVRNANGTVTGGRIDGPHSPRTHPDLRAQRPHAHVPGVTNSDGTPWLPIR